MEATIGRITWDACGECGHYDQEEGCTVDDIDIERVGNHVICSEFMKK